VGERPGRRRGVALLVVAAVVVAALVTGRLWPVAVDHGGTSAGNPISRYGPHWLYPTLAAVMLAGLLWALLRADHRPAALVFLTAYTAGAASNLAQWLVLGGVSNPVGPVPGIHGSGQLSIGDVCLWIGTLAALAALLRPGPARPARPLVATGPSGAIPASTGRRTGPATGTGCGEPPTGRA
jgi:hypothetical protein